MKITIDVEGNSAFRFLWLKNVVDVDLSNHCAKCLLGDYVSEVTPRKNHFEIELSEKVYYLCGVAYPFVWENNFHLAFMECKGSNLTYSSNGIAVSIKDGVRLPITENNIDKNHPKAKFKSYRTCRNWQFAHFFNRYLKH